MYEKHNNDKADKSSLSTVATSGSYNDLSNKPTIPAALSVIGDIEIKEGTATTARAVSAYQLKEWIDWYVSNIHRWKIVTELTELPTETTFNKEFTLPTYYPSELCIIFDAEDDNQPPAFIYPYISGTTPINASRDQSFSPLANDSGSKFRYGYTGFFNLNGTNYGQRKLVLHGWIKVHSPSILRVTILYRN